MFLAWKDLASKTVFCVLINVCTLASGLDSPHGNYIHDSNKNMKKKSLNKLLKTQLLNFSEDGRTIYTERIKHSAPPFPSCNTPYQGFDHCKSCLDGGKVLRAWAGLASTTNISQYCRLLMMSYVSVFNESRVYKRHSDKHHPLEKNEIYHIFPASMCVENDVCYSLEITQLILSILTIVSENYCCCPRVSDLKRTTP